MSLACFDGCCEDYYREGDNKDDATLTNLKAALGPRYEVLACYGSDEGYGHHSYETIFLAHDGKVILAQCGGCSCGGSGSWSFEQSVQSARGAVPDYRRESDRNKEDEGVYVNGVKVADTEV